VICALAGGVGAAKFLVGLCAVVDPAEVTVVVNTGDDVELHGLWVSPDLDTVTYTLAGEVNPSTGWGLAEETWSTMDALERYGAGVPTWFRLGDRDLATHLYRTGRLRAGATVSQVAAEIARAWGVRARLLPMSDDRVETRVTLAAESSGQTSGEPVEVGFQEYFVERRHSVPVRAVRFAGALSASPAPGVVSAVEEASLVVICPSNPIVSIGPIRSLRAVESALGARRSTVVAVSPIVGGAALKGPADRLLRELGHESSVVGVARLYAPVAATLVVDSVDAPLADAVQDCGVRAVVAPTVMHTPAAAASLARTVLAAVPA